MIKKWLPLLLQSLVSVAFLAWIFREESFRASIGGVVASALPGWLLLAVLVAGIANIVGIVRWGIFLRMQGIHIGAGEIVRIGFVGLFCNLFLVGAVGGDAVKVVWLATKGHSKSGALLSVLMDRMSGLIPLVVCSALFILLRLDWLMQSAAVAATIKFVFIYLAVVAVLLGLSFVPLMAGSQHGLPVWLPVRHKILEFGEAYALFLRCWKQTLVATFFSLVILLLHFLTFFLCAQAFLVRIPILNFFAMMPAVDIISALPISLGGVGVREQLFATLLGDLCGVAAPVAVSISLAGFLASSLWGLAGLFFMPSVRSASSRS